VASSLLYRLTMVATKKLQEVKVFKGINDLKVVKSAD